MGRIEVVSAAIQPKGTSKKEQKETVREYDPLKILHERERFDEKTIYIKEGIPVHDDPENTFVFHQMRKYIKEGSLLDLGAGTPHVHQMCALADKLKHITALDISPINNKFLKEILEAPLKKGRQEMIEPKDVWVLKMLAEAISRDKRFAMKNIEGKDILPTIYEKSIYKGQPDIITADMIEDMSLLGSGEILDGRSYDNILLSFAIFAQSEAQLQKFLENVQRRLKEGGRLIIIDFETYAGPELGDELVFAEDPLVVEKYPNVFDWSDEQMNKILKEIGFTNVHKESHEISDVHSIERQCKRYEFLRADKGRVKTIYRI